MRNEAVEQPRVLTGDCNELDVHGVQVVLLPEPVSPGNEDSLRPARESRGAEIEGAGALPDRRGRGRFPCAAKSRLKIVPERKARPGFGGGGPHPFRPGRIRYSMPPVKGRLVLNFLKDDRNRLHGPRIAWIVYTTALLLGLPFDYWNHDVRRRRYLPRVVFTVGSWLAFCDKRPGESIYELLRSSHRAIGAALVGVGLIAGFYWPFH